MAKKQYTPEEYKAKLDKKADKNKRFSSTFLKVLAFCLAITMVFCATLIAYKRMGTYSLGTAGSVVAGNQNTNNDELADNNDSMDWGDTDTQTPSTDDVTNNNSDSSNNTVNDNNGNANTDNNADSEEKPAGDIMTSKTMQFDLFVKAFTGVKTNAASVTIPKKNAYNYDGHVEAGALSWLGDILMGSLLKEEEVNETYTGDDIAAKFPPSGATCGLTKDDVKNITCKEEGDYYIITVTVKGSKNPTAGKGVGAVASILTKESIEAPLKQYGMTGLTFDCDYKDTTAEAKIEKSTGNLVEYYFNLPMYLYIDGKYSVGLGFEEWWTVAY